MNAQYTTNPVVHNFHLQSNQKGFDHIYSLETDSNGTIYLATNKGIYYFDGQKIVFISQQINKFDYPLLHKSKNHIYALPYNGYIVDISNPTMTLKFLGNEKYQCKMAYDDSLGSNHFLLYYQSKFYDGIVTKNGHQKIIQLNGYYNFIRQYISLFIKSETEIKKLLPIISQSNHEIRIKKNRFLLIDNKCFDMHLKKAKLVYDGHGNGFKESVLIDKWVVNEDSCLLAIMGKKKGLYWWANNTIIAIDTLHEVNAVVRDKFGQIFYTTYHKQLFKIGHTSVTKHNYNTTIETLLPDNNTPYLYLKSNDGNLLSIHLKSNDKLMLLSNAKGDASIHGLYQEQNETVFFTKNKTYTVADNTSIFNSCKLQQYYSTGSKKQYHFDREWQCIVDKKYIATYHTSWAKYKEILAPYNIQSSYQFKEQNTIELGTSQGIYHLILNAEKPSLQKIITHTFLDESDILFYAETSRALFYYCEKGIVKHDLIAEKFSIVLATNNEHPFNDINQLFIYNNYLIGVNQYGFASYQISTGELNELQFLDVNKNIETLKNGFVKDSLLYFYSNSSIYTLPLSYLYESTPLPTIILNSLESDMNAIKHKTIKTFEFNKLNNLIFSFFVHHLQQNENYAWHYDLVHNNDTIINKQPFSNHQITLNNLPYGDYKLLVNFKNKLIFTQAFTLLPKWHQTLWFKVSLTSILFAIGLWLLYYFLRKKHHQNIVQLEQKHKIFALESSAKLNQLKPHFVFNALTPLQKYIIRNDSSKALHFLKDLSILLRQMLNMSRTDYTILGDELAFISNYMKIKLEELSYSFDFNYHSTIQKHEEQIIKVPSFFVQPILENALHYGIPSTPFPNHPFIHISVSLITETLIQIEIKDSGKGFDLEQEIALKKNNALYIIHERLLLLKKQHANNAIGIKSSFSENSFYLTIILPIHIN